MKKLFTLFAAIALCFPAFATTFTFNSEADLNQTVDGITVTVAKASGNNPPTFYDNGLRLYVANTITVSGSNLQSMKLSFAKQGQKEYASLTASVGSLVSGGISTSSDNPVTDTWSGSASSVTFTVGTGQRLLLQLVVNGDGSESLPEGPGTNPGTPDTPSELNPDFVYPEPTKVTVPATTVQGDAYSFISNNVLVSCTKGAITDSYFSAHAGFDLTFTATRPIKGIVIDGMVKKGFEATVNHGKISYLTPEDADTDANPCVVISDIDAESVTISCVKQLRCYSVEVYFDENPQATVSGGSIGGGEEIPFHCTLADAVYEKEFSELVGEVNYSIFLGGDEPFPYFSLDIYPEAEGKIAGNYSWDALNLGDYTYYQWGEGEDDYLWAVGGEVSIAQEGEFYTITGSVTLENGNTYILDFKGSVSFFTDDEYYGGGDDDSAVEKVEYRTSEESDGPAYDLQGRPVSKAYRGIVIRSGRKEIQH